MGLHQATLTSKGKERYDDDDENKFIKILEEKNHTFQICKRHISTSFQKKLDVLSISI